MAARRSALKPPAEPAAIILPPAPYPGLRPFEPDEWPIFFGRESMIQDVISRVIDKNLVAVHGDSGCGKSSLVGAGVLPLLERDQARAGDSWRTAVFRPGDRPLANFAEALARLEDGADRDARILDFRRVLNFGAAAPAELAKRLRRGPRDYVCILFDQFEELFEHARRGGETEARLVAEFLVGLNASRPQGLHAILTMRSDYLGSCALYRGFAETVNETQYLVPRMERPALLRAIREPAALYGGAVDHDLASRLIADAGTGQDQLPLIQHGLMLLWRKKTEGLAAGTPWQLTAADYSSAGNLSTLLSRHADDVMAEAVKEPGDARIVEELFRALTDIGGDGQAIRRPRAFGDLKDIAGAEEPALRRIVDRFRDPDVSFLRPYGAAPVRSDTRIDISHEALIRNWTKISDPAAGWLAKEIDDGLVWNSLRVAAKSYRRDAERRLSPAVSEERNAWIAGRNEAWSARYGGDWAGVNSLIADSRSAAERQRQEREEQQRQKLESARQRRRVLTFMASLGVVVAVLASLLAFYANKQRLRALDSEKQAIAFAAETEKQRISAVDSEKRAIEAAREAEMQRSIANQSKEQALAAFEEANVARIEAIKSEQRANDAAAEARRLVAKMQRQETLRLAILSLQATADGDSVTGMLLALRALPSTFDPPDRELRPEAIRALYYGMFAQRERRMLAGHRDNVWSTAFSPDGTLVVTGSADKTARLWSVETGAEIKVLAGHGDRIWSAAFSLDGARVVTASADKTARLWNAATGAEIAVLPGHEGEVMSAAFSPDGKRVVTASYKTVRLWDVATAKEIAVLKGHEGYVRFAAFSADGKRVVTASEDKTARLWDAETGKETLALRNHTNIVTTAAMSPDGSTIATASFDKTVRLWDAATGSEIAVLEGHSAVVNSATFSPDGTQLVTASTDKSVRLWDVAGRKQIALLKGHQGIVNFAAFSPDGEWLVTASADQTARIWDAAPGRDISVLRGHENAVIDAAFSPDGALVATASADTTVRLWNAVTAKEAAVLRGHESSVLSVAFSPDGRRVVSASYDKTARLWDVAAAKEIAVLRGHEKGVCFGAFSPDGTRIVTTSQDHTARLWDATTDQEIAVLRGHENEIWSAAFAPDGKRVATASDDMTVRLWDAADGRAIGTPFRGHKDVVWSVAFSPDGKRLVTGSADDTAQVWDIASGSVIAVFKGHRNDVVSVAFSLDGTRVITASGDATVRMWDAASGKEMAVFEGHEDTVRSASFSPDGMKALSASDDKTARIWPLMSSIKQAVAEATKRLPRQLTLEQQKEYFLIDEEVPASP